MDCYRPEEELFDDIKLPLANSANISNAYRSPQQSSRTEPQSPLPQEKDPRVCRRPGFKPLQECILSRHIPDEVVINGSFRENTYSDPQHNSHVGELRPFSRPAGVTVDDIFQVPVSQSKPTIKKPHKTHQRGCDIFNMNSSASMLEVGVQESETPEGSHPTNTTGITSRCSAGFDIGKIFKSISRTMSGDSHHTDGFCDPKSPPGSKRSMPTTVGSVATLGESNTHRSQSSASFSSFSVFPQECDPLRMESHLIEQNMKEIRAKNVVPTTKPIVRYGTPGPHPSVQPERTFIEVEGSSFLQNPSPTNKEVIATLGSSQWRQNINKVLPLSSTAKAAPPVHTPAIPGQFQNKALPKRPTMLAPQKPGMPAPKGLTPIVLLQMDQQHNSHQTRLPRPNSLSTEESSSSSDPVTDVRREDVRSVAAGAVDETVETVEGEEFFGFLQSVTSSRPQVGNNKTEEDGDEQQLTGSHLGYGKERCCIVCQV